MLIYPTNHPGAVSIECGTGGHGRCREVCCECWHHVQPVDNRFPSHWPAKVWEGLCDKTFELIVGLSDQANARGEAMTDAIGLVGAFAVLATVAALGLRLLASGVIG